MFSATRTMSISMSSPPSYHEGAVIDKPDTTSVPAEKQPFVQSQKQLSSFKLIFRRQLVNESLCSAKPHRLARSAVYEFVYPPLYADMRLFAKRTESANKLPQYYAATCQLHDYSTNYAYEPFIIARRNDVLDPRDATAIGIAGWYRREVCSVLDARVESVLNCVRSWKRFTVDYNQRGWSLDTEARKQVANLDRSVEVVEGYLMQLKRYFDFVGRQCGDWAFEERLEADVAVIKAEVQGMAVYK